MAIAGRPNAGKSSLFNQLAGAGRAIVADAPGTTRDLLTETIDVEGVPMTIVDTAGVRRDAVDAVETEGIARAVAARATAAVTVLVVDRSLPLTPDDRDLIEATASSTGGSSSRTRPTCLRRGTRTRSARRHWPYRR